ncbi:hypothetical protein [Saccharothrix longispora]|uniref:hypothetical protein n=1 Tax=Saccharothrix longispora TaxID=33920 RepID=UPI0031E58459
MRVTWRRSAPTARSSACSLLRAAASIVKVLATTNTATNNATAANPSRIEVSFPVPARAVPAPTTSTKVPDGTASRTAAASAASEVPAAGVSTILVSPNSSRAVPGSKTASVPPAAVSGDLAETTPETVNPREVPVTTRRTRSPTR